MSKDYGTKPEGFPYMTGPADFGPVYPVVTKWTHKPKIMATPGCVLVTVKGSGVGKVNILANQEVAIGRQLMALTPADLIDPKYLFYFLTLALRTMQESASGTTVPGLAKNDISEILISIAPYGEQRQLVQKIESLLEQADHVEKAIDAARKCAQSLEEATLSRAFRGELVPQDPNDEPASVILERIRAQRGTMGRKTTRRKLGETPIFIGQVSSCELDR
jgi:type I restriction enzyme S subunit